MDIIHITFLEVRELLLYTFDISGKIVDIHHHAEHITLAVPFSLSFTLRIKRFQLIITLIVIAFHLIAQLCKHIIVAVQFHIQPAELIMMALQPLCKDSVILLFLCLLGCLCLFFCFSRRLGRFRLFFCFSRRLGCFRLFFCCFSRRLGRFCFFCCFHRCRCCLFFYRFDSRCFLHVLRCCYCLSVSCCMLLSCSS